MTTNPTRPHESWEELVPYTLTFGVVHTQLGFKGIDRTAKFLQYLIGEKLIGYQCLEEKDMDKDDEDVMRTQELPRNLKKRTKKRAKLTYEERITLGFIESLEAFFKIRDRLRFNSQEIILIIPLAKSLQKEEMTVEQYIARETKRLALMREESRKSGYLKAAMRSSVLVILGGVIGGGGVAAWYHYPKYESELKQWTEGSPKTSSDTETATLTSANEASVLSSNAEAPVNSHPQTPPLEPHPVIETISPQRIQELRNRAETILNPYQLTIEQCEASFKDWSVQLPSEQRQINMEAWREHQQRLLFLERVQELMTRIASGEKVTALEIESTLNPNNLSLEELLSLQSQWEAEVPNQNSQKHLKRIKTHLKLLELAQELKNLVS